MNVFANRNTRALIFIMCALVLIVVITSHFYYKSVNTGVDVRIVPARTLYEKYNNYAQQNAFDSIFWLMDTVESIYTSFDHYKDSYEIGVLFNNRAASYLTMAQDSNINVSAQDSLIVLAESAIMESIKIYQEWLAKFDGKDQEEIRNILSKNRTRQD